MRKIAILLLLLFSLESMAQSYEENIEKYWYYRHRLKEQFMYFSGKATLLWISYLHKLIRFLVESAVV